jgi:magnesium transporter
MKVDEVVAVDHEGRKLLWVDIEAPSKAELESVAEQYMLPYHAVKDCLDAEHFPKFERFGDLNFIVLRAFDDESSTDCDTVQEITRKIAVFESDSLVITIHRREQKFLVGIKDEWRTRVRLGEDCKANGILLSILSGVIETFKSPMNMNRNLLEEFEVKVFKHSGDTFEDGYFLKRRASTFKRVLLLTLDILPGMSKVYMSDASLLQDVRETGERMCFYAEEFYDNVSNLVTLHLSLQSHRLTIASFKTNEVMRILTIFSVFFMPLNLVTGLYGMNFEHMPELKWENGYHFTLGLMVTITVAVFVFFKRKGFFVDQKDQI